MGFFNMGDFGDDGGTIAIEPAGLTQAGSDAYQAAMQQGHGEGTATAWAQQAMDAEAASRSASSAPTSSSPTATPGGFFDALVAQASAAQAANTAANASVSTALTPPAPRSPSRPSSSPAPSSSSSDDGGWWNATVTRMEQAKASSPRTIAPAPAESGGVAAGFEALTKSLAPFANVAGQAYLATQTAKAKRDGTAPAEHRAAKPSSGIPWWGWLGIAAGALGGGYYVFGGSGSQTVLANPRRRQPRARRPRATRKPRAARRRRSRSR